MSARGSDGRVVGTTSVFYGADFYGADDPAGVEVGATQFAPSVWGTGVNTEVKRLLLAVIFRHGAQWVQLRTDERNRRRLPRRPQVLVLGQLS